MISTLPRHITSHSIERYRQRVESGLSDDEIRDRLSTPAILAGVDLGHCAVRLPTGQRIIIVEHRVVTVAPKPLPAKCRSGRPRQRVSIGPDG